MSRDRSGSALNGFTRQNVLNLGIRNNLTFNSNGDTGLWVIREDEETDELQFLRNDTTQLSLSTTGLLSVNELSVSNLSINDLTLDTLTVNVSADIQTLGITGDLSVGTDVFFVDTTLNQVGIGITTPVNNLHIHQPDSTASQISFTNTTTGTAITDGVIFGLNSDEDMIIRNKESTDIIFYTSNTEKMRIDDTTGGGLTVSAGITASGEITGSLTCNNIGSLGYILLDQQTTADLSTSNFTSFTVDLDNQSNDDFAMYKIMLSMRFDADGGIPSIEAQLRDTLGPITETDSHATNITGFNGFEYDNREQESWIIWNRGATSSIFWSGIGDFTLHTGANHYECNLNGQSHMNVDAGNNQQGRNGSGNLTNSAIITTRITGLGFKGLNIETGGSLKVRVYRLL